MQQIYFQLLIYTICLTPHIKNIFINQPAYVASSYSLIWNNCNLLLDIYSIKNVTAFPQPHTSASMYVIILLNYIPDFYSILFMSNGKYTHINWTVCIIMFHSKCFGCPGPSLTSTLLYYTYPNLFYPTPHVLASIS